MGRTPKPEEGENDKRTPQPSQPNTANYRTPGPSSQQSAAPPVVASPENRNTAERPEAMRAVADNELLARSIKDGSMSGFVGSGTTLTGEANFKGMLRVDGRFTGSISSEKGTLVVSAGGHVEADIRVAAAKINGTVNGDITASERIELGRSAEVNGNIETPALIIEQGAIFEGSCRMVKQRAAADAPRTARGDAGSVPADVEERVQVSSEAAR